MAAHPVFSSGRVAAITGGAGGIGLAAAKRFAALGMKVAIADLDEALLAEAARQIATVAHNGDSDVMTFCGDVSRMEDVAGFREAVYALFGEVGVLMNNAGTGPGGGPFDHYDRWQRVIGVNLWGVINGVHAFTPGMIAQGTPAAIINTGSKQGITLPPGDTAYNVSKAGVKAVTESLQHTLRNTDGCRVTAHLLIPGFTFTGLTRGGRADKPPGAWTPEQVVDFMVEAVSARDFYVLCPDNDVPRTLDEKRMAWTAGDIIENRPPLSRWHADYKAAFEEFLKG